MGSWGIREIESDSGLDRLHSGFYSGIEGNILNVDKAMRDYHDWVCKLGDEGKIARHPEDIKRYIQRSDKDDAIAMAELLHYFKNNIILNTFGRLEMEQQSGWFTVDGVTVSKQMLNYIVNALDRYLITDMETFENSGWLRVEDYNQRIKWISGIKTELKALQNQSNDPVVVFDKQSTPPEVFLYKEKVRFTDDHDLNRLKLFLKNEVRFSVRDDTLGVLIAWKEIKQPYLSVEASIPHPGAKFYCLVYHDIFGERKTLCKYLGIHIDQLIADLPQILEELNNQMKGRFRFYVYNHTNAWNRLYNRDMYTRYYKKIHS